MRASCVNVPHFVQSGRYNWIWLMILGSYDCMDVSLACQVGAQLVSQSPTPRKVRLPVMVNATPLWSRGLFKIAHCEKGPLDNSKGTTGVERDQYRFKKEKARLSCAGLFNAVLLRSYFTIM